MIRHRRLLAPAALLLAAGLIAANATTAEAAAPTTLTICNSTASNAGKRITPWRADTGAPWLYPGDCWSMYNGDGGVRVLVDNGDYQQKPSGGSYSACFNGPKYNSNPYNVSLVYYRLKSTSYC